MIQREPDTGSGIASFLLLFVIGVTGLGVAAFYISQVVSGGGKGIFSFQPVIILFAIAWAILTVMVGLILFNSRRRSGGM